MVEDKDSSKSSKVFSDKCCVNVDKIKTHTYDEAVDLIGVGKYDRCLMAVLSVILLGMGLDMFGFSVVVLGCSCEFQLSMWQKSVLSSTPFAGTIIASFLWGYISDIKGRKRCLVIGTSGAFVFSIIGSLSPHWIVLAVMRLLSSSFCCCAQSATYTLLGESCVQRVRSSYMMILSIPLMILTSIYCGSGYLLLPLSFSLDLGFITYTSWRLLITVLALPLGIGSLALLTFYESPKFLLNANREDEALEVLQKMWIWNGKGNLNFPVKKIILNEENNSLNKKLSLFRSMWEQTVPLFKPPLLIHTAKLFYVTIICYGTNNSLMMWYPLIAETYFTPSANNNATSVKLCELLTATATKTNNGNLETVVCSNVLKENTVFGSLALTATLASFNVFLAKVSARRRLLIMLVCLVSAASATAITFTTNSILTIFFYIVYLQTSALCGFMSAYYVDLYPTSYRGMMACLGVIVARGSSLVSINIVGSLIMTHCDATFYTCSILLISVISVAIFLPPDKVNKKINAK